MKNWSNLSKYRLCIFDQISMFPVPLPFIKKKKERKKASIFAMLCLEHKLKIIYPITLLELRHFLKTPTDQINIPVFPKVPQMRESGKNLFIQTLVS